MEPLFHSSPSHHVLFDCILFAFANFCDLCVCIAWCHAPFCFALCCLAACRWVVSFFGLSLYGSCFCSAYLQVLMLLFVLYYWILRSVSLLLTYAMYFELWFVWICCVSRFPIRSVTCTVSRGVPVGDLSSLTGLALYITLFWWSMLAKLLPMGYGCMKWNSTHFVYPGFYIWPDFDNSEWTYFRDSNFWYLCSRASLEYVFSRSAAKFGICFWLMYMYYQAYNPCGGLKTYFVVVAL